MVVTEAMVTDTEATVTDMADEDITGDKTKSLKQPE